MICHPITGEVLPDDLAALERTERQVDRYLRRQSQHYAFRRALRERIAELRGPAALPPRRSQTPHQQRVQDCPRCSGPPIKGPWDGLAAFSEDGRYRYALRREFGGLLDSGTRMLVVCLNPSTADADHDDPTVRRLRALAQREGHGELVIGNLFALRATDPKDMLAAAEPVGPQNDAWLDRLAGSADSVVCAWGTAGDHRGRGRAVFDLLRRRGAEPLCLGLTRDGHPRHPLYLRRDVELEPLKRVP